MTKVKIVIIESLQQTINLSDAKTQKLFYKQKQFMELNPNYPSLGRTKLKNVCDKYGAPLWEVRLDQKRRIIFVERDNGLIIWLKICTHDELSRKDIISIKDDY